MTRRDRLYEKYEDALFSLWMEEVSEAEGRAALEENERLKNDPDAALPKELQHKFASGIRRGFAAQNLNAAGRAAARVFGKAAIAVTVFVLTFSIAFAASAEVREATMEWVIKTYDDHLEIAIKNGDRITDNIENRANDSQNIILGDIEIAVGWLPDDMELFDSALGNDYLYVDYRDRAGTKQFLVCLKRISDSGIIDIDTENATLSFMDFQGKAALVSTTEQSCTVFLPVDEIGGFATIDSEGLPLEIVKRIIDTLTINSTK